MITLCWEQAFYLHCFGQLEGQNFREKLVDLDFHSWKNPHVTEMFGMAVSLPYTKPGFPGGISGTSKEPACQWRRCKRLVWSLGQENPLEKGMATHSTILAWRIPWTEEPGRLQFIGSQKVRHNWNDLVCMHAHTQICHVTIFLELKNVCTWLNPTTEYKHAAAETTHF